MHSHINNWSVMMMEPRVLVDSFLCAHHSAKSVFRENAVFFFFISFAIAKFSFSSIFVPLCLATTTAGLESSTRREREKKTKKDTRTHRIWCDNRQLMAEKRLYRLSVSPWLEDRFVWPVYLSLTHSRKIYARLWRFKRAFHTRFREKIANFKKRKKKCVRTIEWNSAIDHVKESTMHFAFHSLRFFFFFVRLLE